MAVFPCKSKRPTTPAGFKDASTSRDVIKAWFAEHPELNVAVAIPSNRVVLDIDGPEGEKNLAECGFVPPSTATTITGKGRHLWYEWNHPVPPMRKVGFLPKVDLLCNGYVLMPPSKHTSGGEYRWDVPLTSENTEMAPQWMATLVAGEMAKRDKIEPDDYLMGLPTGERQTGLFRYACWLRGMPRFTLGMAKVQLREVANRSGSEGYNTDKLADRVWKTYDAAEDAATEEDQEPQIRSLADIAGAGVSPPVYLVEDMLPGMGYTLIQAPPKEGKSLMACKIAASVACGSMFLGKKVTQGGVLHLDLEQHESTAFPRWEMILGGMGISGFPSNLYTAYTWPTLDNGALDKISKFLVEFPNVSLVVIDTLYNFWPEVSTGGGNAYHQDARTMRPFLKVSRDYGVAFLIVHHTSKDKNRTAVQRTSGTYGIAGPAASVLDLQRTSENSDDATLFVRGRNVPRDEIKVWLGKDLCWRQL